MDMRTLQQIVQAGFADNALAGQLHCSFRQGVGGRQPCRRQPLSLSVHARLLFLHSGQALAWIRGECGTEGCLRPLVVFAYKHRASCCHELPERSSSIKGAV